MYACHVVYQSTEKAYSTYNRVVSGAFLRSHAPCQRNARGLKNLMLNLLPVDIRCVKVKCGARRTIFFVRVTSDVLTLITQLSRVHRFYLNNEEKLDIGRVVIDINGTRSRG